MPGLWAGIDYTLEHLLPFSKVNSREQNFRLAGSIHILDFTFFIIYFMGFIVGGCGSLEFNNLLPMMKALAQLSKHLAGG